MSLKFVWILSGLALLAALWLVGGLVYFRDIPYGAVPLEEQINLAVMAALSSATAIRAATVRGSAEDKLNQVIITGVVLFGTYALIILMGRYFFSRLVLSTAIPSTLLLSVLIIWLRHRSGGVSVAVIAPLVKARESKVDGAVVLHNPDSDFRSFDLLLVDLHEPVSGEWARALSRAMLSGCRVRHIQDHLEELSGAVSIKDFELEHLPSTNQESYIEIKRLMDIAGVIVLTPFALVLIALASLAIVITSGWPVFFIQQRVGLGGRPFRMWKLRTMRPCADGAKHAAAVPGDNRITWIGGILRRTRIDELPQLWNVLKGEMSLIGPRPEAHAFHNDYTEVHPKFAYRCLVRPGITGWAQVNVPPSANADEALTKLRYDLYYVKRQSIGLDLRIALRTVWTITHGSGVR